MAPLYCFFSSGVSRPLDSIAWSERICSAESLVWVAITMVSFSIASLSVGVFACAVEAASLAFAVGQSLAMIAARASLSGAMICLVSGIGCWASAGAIVRAVRTPVAMAVAPSFRNCMRFLRFPVDTYEMGRKTTPPTVI